MLFPFTDQSVECLYKSLFQIGIVYISVGACNFPILAVVLALPLYDSP